MVLREVTRRPMRLALSCLGLALGIAVVVVGSFTQGALDTILDLQFETAQREDLVVTFTRALGGGAVRELGHVPGVLATEPLRVVPVRIRAGHRFRDVVLTGHPKNADLRRVVEWPRRVVQMPDEGLLVTDALARVLGVGVGDLVTVDVLEGDRRTRRVRVSALTTEMFGMNAHMALPALHALLDEGDVVSMALLSVDPESEDAIDLRLKHMPRIASVSRRSDVVLQFETQSAESTRATSVVLTLFGCTIAIGIVYNNARVALSARARDLASLRVLGFTRGEMSGVLLGEMAVQVLLSIPLGLVLGRWLAVVLMSAVEQELFRIPTVITARTYAFAVVVTVLSALASALVVRRDVDRLDLVAVLKARE